VAVGCRLGVNGAQKVEHIDNAFRPQIEVLAHQHRNLLVTDDAGPIGIDRDVDRLGDTNSIADLHLALAGQAGSHNVLGHVTCGIGSRTVDLGRIFTREGTATVRASAAVGIDDDLTARKPAITLRAANYKDARWVDHVLGLGGKQTRSKAGLDDLFDNRFANICLRNIGRMLSGKHHRVNTPRDNAFRANYKENFPNWSLDVYAVQGYDAAQMLDAGLKAVNGDVSKKDAMRDAIRTAKIDSPRGEFTLSKAGNPVQDIYLRKVEGDENKVVKVAVEKLADPARGCKL